MAADRQKPSELTPEIIAQLACPACHGVLRLTGSQLVCTGCGCVYPIIDGIPVLIANRAQRS